jgi:hypothetical protein
MIPHINVIQPTLAGDDNVAAPMEQNQHHLGVIYNFHAPFTKYASCICKWALCRNVCKHQSCSHDMPQTLLQTILLYIVAHGMGPTKVDLR